MSYTQLTPGERYTLSALRQEGLSNTQIAKRLRRHRTTVWRELKRNCLPDGRYRPSRGQEKANARRRISRQGSHYSESDFERVRQSLYEGWSPEQISGRFESDGTLSISHETIYRFIRLDRFYGGLLYKALRGARKLRRKWHNSIDNRGRLVGKRHISERPPSVEERTTFGHWEVDTVVGKNSKHCVVTLVERKSGYAIVGKLRNRSKLEMSSRLKWLIARSGRKFKTITSDNGTEFHDYESVEKETGVRFYFATPYHSWERASNENFNGLLRQYIPKNANQSSLTQRDCDAIARRLNTRPRKRLNYRTPEECFLTA